MGFYDEIIGNWTAITRMAHGALPHRIALYRLVKDDNKTDTKLRPPLRVYWPGWSKAPESNMPSIRTLLVQSVPKARR